MSHFRPFALALAAGLALSACETPVEAPPEAQGVISTAENRRLELWGRLAGDEAAFAGASVLLQDGDGQTFENMAPVSPDAKGAFSVPRVFPGSYIARVTFADKTTQEAVISTQTTYNPVSPGSSLATAYARQLLTQKLVFLEELPALTLLGLGVELDRLLTEQKIALEQDADKRLNQFNQLKGHEAVKGLITELDRTVATRDGENRKRRPGYISEARYAAKQQKLGL